MISLKELETLSVKNQVAILHVAREYLQNLFLSFFYSESGAEMFMFKGGTCLKIVYLSPRYSEDLDFTGQDTTFKTFENLLQKVLLQFEKTGISTGIEECKRTTGGFLAVFKSELHEIKVRVSLQVSMRRGGNHITPDVVLINNDFIPAYNAVVLPLDVLVKEKSAALLQRAKPRDFYDLYFMLRHPVMRKAFSSRERIKLLGALDCFSGVDLQRDLKPFLPKSQRQIIKNLPKAIKRELC